MRFAFDVDGVITEMPELFSAITSALKASGHSIIILTDFDEAFRSYREDELKRLGIAYDELIITPHKERYFRDNNVDYAFDDDPEYYKDLRVLPFFGFGKR
jgi:ribonucleotide monophosphatase NagD (HAD superfamily)